MKKIFNQNYQFNPNTLEFETVIPYKLITVSILLFVSILMLFSFTSEKEISDKEKELIILNSQSIFTHELLIDEIKKYSFKFPYIILAQAIEESNHYKSPIFKENSNLFGMKEASIRLHVSTGTNRNHAMFDNWRDSVLDRALFDASFMRNLSEEEYFMYLNSYAENPSYVKNLKKIIDKYNLKSEF
jgi:uncharacterized FlgJ-related protein